MSYNDSQIRSIVLQQVESIAKLCWSKSREETFSLLGEMIADEDATPLLPQRRQLSERWPSEVKPSPRGLDALRAISEEGQLSVGELYRRMQASGGSGSEAQRVIWRLKSQGFVFAVEHHWVSYFVLTQLGRKYLEIVGSQPPVECDRDI